LSLLAPSVVLYVKSPSSLYIFTLMALVLNAWYCATIRNHSISIVVVIHFLINQSINQSINQWRGKTQAHLRIVLKTLVLISNNLYIKLRSISGTGKVGSVINFHILELPKVVKSRLKCINRVNINYSIRQTVPNINYSISERKLSKISIIPTGSRTNIRALKCITMPAITFQTSTCKLLSVCFWTTHEDAATLVAERRSSAACFSASCSSAWSPGLSA